MNKDRKIILGIDPGTTVLGYGIIQTETREITLVSMGVVQLHKLENQHQKLKRIFEKVTWLVEQYSPEVLAIEAPFFGKNVQSMLKLGRAQGVAIAAALNKNLPVFEYAPKKIKQSITGNGNASKEQVGAMLQQIMKIQGESKFLDATDALASAVCHHFQNGKIPSAKIARQKNYQGWGAFIANNPKRIKQ